MVIATTIDPRWAQPLLNYYKDPHSEQRMTCIINHIDVKCWDVITHLYFNFNLGLVKQFLKLEHYLCIVWSTLPSSSSFTYCLIIAILGNVVWWWQNATKRIYIAPCGTLHFWQWQSECQTILEITNEREGIYHEDFLKEWPSYDGNTLSHFIWNTYNSDIWIYVCVEILQHNSKAVIIYELIYNLI